MKYGLAASAMMAFIALLWITSGSVVSTLLLFAAWEVAGLLWLSRCSYIAKLWRYRRRGFWRGVARVMFIPLYVLPWPIWLAVGEDVFD